VTAVTFCHGGVNMRSRPFRSYVSSHRLRTSQRMSPCARSSKSFSAYQPSAHHSALPSLREQGESGHAITRSSLSDDKDVVHQMGSFASFEFKHFADSPDSIEPTVPLRFGLKRRCGNEIAISSMKTASPTGGDQAHFRRARIARPITQSLSLSDRKLSSSVKWVTR
jgi:hypothetical protein